MFPVALMFDLPSWPRYLRALAHVISDPSPAGMLVWSVMAVGASTCIAVMYLQDRPTKRIVRSLSVQLLLWGLWVLCEALYRSYF